MGKSLLEIIADKIADQIFDTEFVGKRGEKLTERELKLVEFFGRKGKTLRNIYLPKDNGDTSEIDLVFITQKGIFVFESKNYSGWIFGDEKSTYWTVMLSSKEKNRFYNPIRQNRTHIHWLSRYLGENIPLFSIVVFSERCELKKVEVASADVRVIKRDSTYACVRDIWDANPDVLTEDEVTRIYEKCKALTNADHATKQAHIDSINSRYGKKGEVSSANDSSLEFSPLRICPKCGKPLVIRTARKGDNVGKQFYGCSSFPQCRFTGKIE